MHNALTGQAGHPATPDSLAGPDQVGERDALILLVTVEGLGPATLGRLVRRLGGARRVVRLAATRGGAARLMELGGEPGRSALAMDLARRIVDAAGQEEGILHRIRESGVEPVTILDPTYPDRLRTIALPPHVLFVRGSAAALNGARAVGVVGTRRPTESGRRLAAQLGAALSDAGAVVVSGLAIGVDGASHAAVVESGGRTVAVLGGGHAALYPRAHARLADEIVRSGGAVVSEFAPDVAPTPGMFPRRNRLISGLSEAVVVVEAAARSGALTTAAWALEQGRGCFLVPGSIGAPMSEGCLSFLRECPGEARIVAGIPQLLEDLGLVGVAAGDGQGGGTDQFEGRARRTSPAPEAVLRTLGGVERSIVEGLIGGLATVDELVAALDLPVATVLGGLTLLEVRGLVHGAYGRYLPGGPLAGARTRG